MGRARSSFLLLGGDESPFTPRFLIWPSLTPPGQEMLGHLLQPCKCGRLGFPLGLCCTGQSVARPQVLLWWDPEHINVSLGLTKLQTGFVLPAGTWLPCPYSICCRKLPILFLATLTCQPLKNFPASFTAQGCVSQGLWNHPFEM